MINQITLEGYVCKGVDVRATQSGKERTRFTLNCPKRRQVNGRWENVPRFARCTYWHHENDFRAPQILEGARLVVTGELDFEEWEGRDGQKRSENPVNVRELVTVAPRDNGGAQPRQNDRYDDGFTPDLVDESIPF